jgi:hypothetical protein
MIWETVIERQDTSEYTDRLAVPGGWLYRTVLLPWSETQPPVMAMCFVPARPQEDGLCQRLKKKPRKNTRAVLATAFGMTGDENT